MKRVFVALLVVALLAVPTVTAQRGLILGTEDLPELWGDGVVNYSPLNPGSQDHDYLAINRSWFDTNPDSGELTLHLRVLDSSNLASTSTNWFVTCGLNATLTINGTATGNQVRWRFYYSNGQVTSNTANVAPTGTPDTSPPASGTTPIKNTFKLQAGEPGYYEWTVRKFDLQRFGTNLTNLQAACGENFGANGLSVHPSPNRSAATSKSDYSLEEERRVAGPDGQLDPIERFERENATGSPTSNSVTTSDRGTPALGASAFFLAIGTSLFAWRRRQ